MLRKLVGSWLALSVVLLGCGATPQPGNTVPQTGGASSGGSGGSAVASGGMSTAGGTTGGDGTAGTATAGSSSIAGTGGTDAAAGGSVGAAGGGGMTAVGGASGIPAGYTGTPFKALTIPGFIYAADYDKGGAGVGYCHVGAASPPNPTTCGVAKLNDWCCGTQKGCDQRTQPTACPIYRQDNDNAGLSHMNTGEPDNYAASGPTWVAGADGPTLTGPMAVAGTPVPMHPNTTTVDDTYISYMYTGQWSQYTVEVMAAGTYAIGGLLGSPGGTTIQFDFGNGVTSGPITVPVSPIAQCKCPETYHSWNIVSNMGTVTFPAPGTYLMKFTLLTQQFNPLYFTFSKM
ncbi:MAG TPA: hypothetical protein VNW92_16735 [Polyangiaceae bacterium]|nr:hypothetical protein [Polyangiaceae bacterium]